jgi:hypothetical protein
MADSSRSTRVPLWVTLADVLALSLVALAFAVALTTGIRTTIAGIFISVTSPIRPLVFAAVVAAIRHAAFRGPRLDRRLAATRWVEGTPLTRDPDMLPPNDRHARSPITGLEIAVVTTVMVILTAVLTYPQIRHLDGVSDLGDPVFSIWRLAWIAHQLPRDPLHLFDANIFYPSRFALAYSDSALLPGLVAAPFIWLGMSPTTAHSLFLLASFVLAGLCMYLFIRSTTGQPLAALVAGVAFAFYPYRFDQYCHFEQLFSFWMPLALWALHRTLTRGRLIDGLLTGAAMAAQYLSGMYLGAFFVAYLVPVSVVFAVGSARFRQSIKPLLAGAALAIVLVAPAAVPHFHVRQVVGERPPSEVAFYSARPAHYLVARTDRVAYAELFGRGPHEGEKELFPGILVVLLAVIALWPPLSTACVAYALGLVFAFEASLGMHGRVFPFLYWTFIPFRAFRVPARFSMLVGLSLVVLAGYGVGRLMSHIRRSSLRYGVAAVLVAGFVFEAWSDRPLQQVWPRPPAIYDWFHGRPPSVLAELPTATDERRWDPETTYMYFSTFHWQRLLNGYSGAFPQSYFSFRRTTATFPDDNSVRILREQGADYVVLHEDLYGRARYRKVVDQADQRADLQKVVQAVSGGYEARVYRLVK